MTESTSSHTHLSAVHGDITRQPDCDCIVNAAKRTLGPGGGVCGAIHAAAGPELARYCALLGPVPVASALLTPGFGLPNRYVIHTVGPRFDFDADPHRLLELAMVNTLAVADAAGVRRIAVPAVSMGTYRFPAREGAERLISIARKMRPGFQSLEEVRFVLYEPDVYAAFAEALACPA
jgi:O-acetyl-ADP-ribose deacetylase (regulator of RNase III)